MFGSIGIPELLLIFGIVLLLFGARKIPEVGRGLGKGIKNFKEALSGVSSEGDEEKKQGEVKEVKKEN
jgi:sec-independent protein translocase protein TatA